MKLTWKEYEEIAWALADANPQLDPLRLSFPALRQMVLALPEFEDDANGCNEAILESIQMAWHEEKS
jgi:FeS assembly protein IscX